MIKVIGVRFRTAGKVYFFDPLQFTIKRGDNVIVETARGIEFGTVVSAPYDVEEDKVVQPLKPVIRVANERDKKQEQENREKEKEAFRICQEKIRKHGLEMKLIDAEYTFDNNKVLFYFTADGRIDFRELVKDLASVFKTRIELRQIGVRDETKIMGGIGICGRPLCCHSYLSDFVPVSIKMAKEQNLSLNPTKISGVCGRLMCCLKNEEDTYEELNRKLPGIGDFVTTEDGLKGEVHSVNVLRQLVKVVVDVDDEKEIREYEVEQLRFKRKHGKKEHMDLSKEELWELQRLEKEEEAEIADKSEKPEKGGQNKPHNKPNHGNRKDHGNAADKNSERDGEKGADRNIDNATDKSTEQTGDKPADKKSQEGREQRYHNKNKERGDRNNRNRHRGQHDRNKQGLKDKEGQTESGTN